MTIAETLAARYQLRHIDQIEVGQEGDRLVVHCPTVDAANALFEDVLLDGITVPVDLMARDLNCPQIEVRVEDQEWLSYELEDVEAIRQIFFI